MTRFYLFLLRLAARLPFSLGIRAGQRLGILLYHLVVKRRRVAEVNIGLCFPELSVADRQQMVRECFVSHGIGVIETAWAFWGSKKRYRNRITVKGAEHLDAAQAQGRGVILLSGHFSTLDLGGRLLSEVGYPFCAMYRKHDNPIMDQAIRDGRSRYSTPIERKNIREVIRKLKDNQIVWYAPDQDFGPKTSVFVPFFGHPAATTTGTSKMMRFNDSPIVLFAVYHNEDHSGYILEFSPVDGLPSGDATEDAAIVNAALEQAIRKAPAQYLWLHKRFKTQPDGEQKLYRQAGC